MKRFLTFLEQHYITIDKISKPDCGCSDGKLKKKTKTSALSRKKNKINYDNDVFVKYLMQNTSVQ